MHKCGDDLKLNAKDYLDILREQQHIFIHYTIYVYWYLND